jgi:hypothetical protein
MKFWFKNDNISELTLRQILSTLNIQYNAIPLKTEKNAGTTDKILLFVAKKTLIN